MRNDSELEKLFRPVADYYQSRLAAKGDVYGWGRLSGLPSPTALLLVDPTADEVPDQIGGIDIVVKRIEAPEAL
jgi:hypothetical protein